MNLLPCAAAAAAKANAFLSNSNDIRKGAQRFPIAAENKGKGLVMILHY